jgi:uncharacterized RDD family membrane protein YckC
MMSAMEYEESRTIATPEGVQLELPLAGLGTRFLAIAIDLLIAGVAGLILLLFGAAVAGDVGATIAGAVFLLGLYIGYQVIFEVAGGGRTLGKRAAGIRVVMDGGAPVGLRASLIRNVFRLLEGLTFSYLPAIVCVLASRNNQRIGDHAAGTLVVRELKAAAPVQAPQPVPQWATASWDVAGVDERDVTAVRIFLDRRSTLQPGARAALAAELAGKLRPLVPGARGGLPDEAFLEHLISAKSRAIAPPDGGSIRPGY